MTPNGAAAFGDNFNDEPMLPIGGRPRVMEEAGPVLKEHFPNHCRRVADVLGRL